MKNPPSTTPHSSYNYSISWIAVNGEKIVMSPSLENTPNPNPSFSQFRSLFIQYCNDNNEQQLKCLCEYLELSPHALSLAKHVFDYISSEVWNFVVIFIFIFIFIFFRLSSVVFCLYSFFAFFSSFIIMNIRYFPFSAINLQQWRLIYSAIFG